MTGKILREASREFVGGTLDISVERGYYGRDFFPLHRFIVTIQMVPDGVSGLNIAELKFDGETRGHRGAGHFLKIVQLPVEEIVTPNAAVLSIDRTVAARGTQRAEKNFFDHFGGRFCPALVFVGAHALASGTIDDVILAVEMRGLYRPHENG